MAVLVSQARSFQQRLFRASGLLLVQSHTRRKGAVRWFAWTNRQIADLESQLHDSITTQVKDPILQTPLKELDWLHRRVSVTQDDETNKSLHLLLRLPSLLHPQLVQLKSLVHAQATQVVNDWLREQSADSSGSTPNIHVEALAHTTPIPMMARLVDDHADVLRKLGPGLQSVAHVIAVYSAKGGVGKSTVAVNLAYTLAQQGGRVGLLDVDVYGPSLPVLVQPDDRAVKPSPLGKGMVYPLEHENVKLLSMGFVNQQSGVPGSGQDNGAAIMKGPMVVKVVTQLLKATDWGALDVLVLDLPPGTGDVQLAVLQSLQLSGAVAVTTPSKLAVEDAKKGIQMFTSLGVPTLAILENMAYLHTYDDDGNVTGKQHVFGKGSGATPVDPGTPGVIEMPLSPAINDCNEQMHPLMLQRPEHARTEMAAYETLAREVSTELLRLHYGVSSTAESHTVTFASDPEQSFDLSTLVLKIDKTGEHPNFVARFVSASKAMQLPIQPAQLRSVDPKTGESLPDSPFSVHISMNANNGLVSSADPVSVTHSSAADPPSKRPPSILPVTVERRGRYGFAVEWGDGATIIYSLRAIASAAGGRVVAKTE